MHQPREEIAPSFFRADATEHEMKAFICSDVSGYTNCALVCQSLYNGPPLFRTLNSWALGLAEILCAGSTNFPPSLYYTVEWKNIDNFMCTSDIFSMEKGKRGNNGSYSASRHVHRALGRDRPILYSPDRPMNMKCHTCLGLMSFALRVAMLVLCPCWRLSVFVQRGTFTPYFGRSTQLNSLLQRPSQPLCGNAESAILL